MKALFQTIFMEKNYYDWTKIDVAKSLGIFNGNSRQLPNFSVSADINDHNFGKNRYMKTNLGSKESLKKVLLL